MANEQNRPPPTGNEDRVQAWLKNQEGDPEAQARQQGHDGHTSKRCRYAILI